MSSNYEPKMLTPERLAEIYELPATSDHADMADGIEDLRLHIAEQRAELDRLRAELAEERADKRAYWDMAYILHGGTPDEAVAWMEECLAADRQAREQHRAQEQA